MKKPARILLLFVAAGAFTGLGHAQNLSFLKVSTLAGSVSASGLVDGTSGAARFNQPHGIAADVQGNIYVADTGNQAIRKITPQGVVTTLAGTGAPGSADGPAASATFNSPWAVAVDASGNVFVADEGNSTIREISTAGIVSTVAGTAGMGGFSDGVGAAAQFSQPDGITIDSAGNLYVADAWNNNIRKITPAFVVTTLAGSTMPGGPDGGLSKPAGLAVDPSGNVYVAEPRSPYIMMVSPEGVVSPVPMIAETSNGSYPNLAGPTAVARDAAGNLYVSDETTQVGAISSDGDVSMISPAGMLWTLAGGNTGSSADGVGPLAGFQNPSGIAIDASGNIYISDTSDDTIRVAPFASPDAVTVTVQPAAATVAEGSSVTLTSNASGTPLLYEWFLNGVQLVYEPEPTNAATLNLSDVTDTDSGSYTLLVIEAGGYAISAPAALTVPEPAPVIITQPGPRTLSVQNGVEVQYSITATNADTYQWSFSGGVMDYSGTSGADSATVTLHDAQPAESGQYWIQVTNNYGTVVSNPVALTVLATPLITNQNSASGSLYYPFQFSLTGSYGPTSFAASSLPPGLSLNSATGVISGIPSAQGSFPISVTATNGFGTGLPMTITITILPEPYAFNVLAGSGKSGAADGTGGNAGFNGASGLAVDAAGNLYVADTTNDTVRFVTPGGVVTTLAGSAGLAGATDGPGSSARFSQPQGVAVDTGGNVYVADTGNDTIRKIAPGGMVSTLAGAPGQAGHGDGLGSAARFNSPVSVAVDHAGNIYVADQQGNSIRLISPLGNVTTVAGSPTPPTGPGVDGSVSTATFAYPASVTVNASGDVYVVDAGVYTDGFVFYTASALRKIAGGQVTTLVTAGQFAAGQDSWPPPGSSPEAAVALDPAGDILVTGAFEEEFSYSVGIWQLTPSGAFSAVPNNIPQWIFPTGMAVDAAGNIYISTGSEIFRGAVSGLPFVAAAPQSENLEAGQTATLSVTASGGPGPLTYQWQWNGSAIPGATGSTFAVPAAGVNQSGSYSVVVSNAAGLSSTSAAATVNVASNAWLANLSARAQVQPGNAPQDALVGGFVTTGSAPKSILIRADGPALGVAPFDMPDALPDPLLTLYNSTGATITTATSWDPTLATTFAALGAFPFAAGSGDAAILQSCAPGLYTAGVTPAEGQPGTSLVELYDADQGAPENRLVNLSARANCAIGDQIIIGGFVIAGTTSETVLVRGVGPALAMGPFNLSGALLAPVLTVFDSAGNVIAADQGWGNPWSLGPSTVTAGIQAPTAAIMASTGAFALPSGSADDALVLTLPPGAYTAELSGYDGGTGIALVEIYEVP